MRGKVARKLRQTAKRLTGIYPKSIPETRYKRMAWKKKDRITGKIIEGPFVLLLPYGPKTGMAMYKGLKKLYKTKRWS